MGVTDEDLIRSGLRAGAETPAQMISRIRKLYHSDADDFDTVAGDRARAAEAEASEMIRAAVHGAPVRHQRNEEAENYIAGQLNAATADMIDRDIHRGGVRVNVEESRHLHDRWAQERLVQLEVERQTAAKPARKGR
jgi:hypothetical protein